MKKSEKLKEWRKQNPEKVAQHLSSQYQKHREKRRIYQREYALKNKERIAEINKRARDNMSPERREAARVQKQISTIARRYGITLEAYHQMLEAQGGTCALCPRTPDQERYNRLNIDHCHDTGKVRGLLCTPCNHAIGVLGDNAEGVKKAVAYLEK